MIEFQNVSKAFANKKILDHANFTIKDQEFFVLVGPSGSGKTTTLKMINQLVTHSEGKILINNEEIQRQIYENCAYLWAMCCSKLLSFLI